MTADVIGIDTGKKKSTPKTPDAPKQPLDLVVVSRKPCGTFNLLSISGEPVEIIEYLSQAIEQLEHMDDFGGKE
ncbi:MAG: hypothetical protein KAR40_11065 [Candidatus Sabulitectum sp.]|nr:hypothetical protein [Candidatus Sabulitectum sp.]